MNLLQAAALAALAIAGFPAMAGTLSREAAFRIDAGPLAGALLRFSEQSGVQVVSAEASVGHLSTQGVHGRMPVGDALQRLLAGTSLQYRPAGEDTVTLLAARAARSAGGPALLTVAALPPLRVEPEPLLAGILDEVTVTAQKHPQSLQDAMLSVSVLDARQLERRGVSGLTDLFSGGVPSLRVASVIGRTSALTIAMRGINSGDVSQLSRDAGVGIYLDGIYLGRSQGLSAEMLDAERIEVLRGPQGTLFGRNALGGAVNVISRKPSGQFGLSQTLGIYNNNGLRAALHLDLPEIADVSVKLDGSLRQRDGAVSNPAAQAWDYGQFRRRGLRAQAAWRPGTQFDALYAFDLSSDQSAPYYLHLTDRTGEQAALPPMFTLEPRPVDVARTAVPLGSSDGAIVGHSLVLSWVPSASTQLRSISGWRSVRQSQFDNWAGASEAFQPERLFARASIADIEQQQFSQELQALGARGALEWIAGAYFFREQSRDAAQEFFTNQFNPDGTASRIVRWDGSGLAVTRASRNVSQSQALFGQLGWRLPLAGERLTVTAGGRYTRDDKAGELTLLYGEPAVPSRRYDFESGRFDPSASLAYAVSDAMNLYLRWGTAYRAGGANSRSMTFRAFGPEEVRSWELGMKSEFLDRRARLNVALYNMDYRRLQVSFFMPDNPVNTETVNTDRPARIRGLELDYGIAFGPRLRLAGTYAWTDVGIPPQPNPFTGEETWLAPVYSPRHAATLEVDYEAGRLGTGRVMLHADANYATGQFTYNSDLLRSRPTALTNLRATLDGLDLAGTRLALGLWVRNLFDRPYELAGIGGPIGPMAIFGEGRSFGVDATMTFGTRL